MDIISRGDFAITNFGGKTTFSFRIPSTEEIDFNDQSRRKPIKAKNKISRNAPGHCGSGKKNKHCHGKTSWPNTFSTNNQYSQPFAWISF